MALFLLGRRLMQIAESVLPKGKGAISMRLVLVDVVYHPGSSISEITERTGFPQSLVSTAVAKLRDRGLLESEPDPTDRRRTLVRPGAALEQVGKGPIASTSVDDAIAREIAPDAGPQGLADALAALDVLTRLITPEVLDEGEPVGTAPAAPGRAHSEATS